MRKAAAPRVVYRRRSSSTAWQTTGLREAFFGYVMEQAYPGEAYRPMFGTLEPRHPVDLSCPASSAKSTHSPLQQGADGEHSDKEPAATTWWAAFKTLVGGTIVTQREIPDAEVPGVLADVFGLRLHR